LAGVPDPVVEDDDVVLDDVVLDDDVVPVEEVVGSGVPPPLVSESVVEFVWL
jgi:hypothetical protein